ncbi:unnamed protein product [Rangifer tarandus platyrhynchus]|uniref:Uncharacterized protein n=1 Tax=Rangifer tarandus platyrhynchus TaxID=3082113 RepID=A0ACB1KHM9_RANTA
MSIWLQPSDEDPQKNRHKTYGWKRLGQHMLTYQERRDYSPLSCDKNQLYLWELRLHGSAESGKSIDIIFPAASAQPVSLGHIWGVRVRSPVWELRSSLEWSKPLSSFRLHTEESGLQPEGCSRPVATETAGAVRFLFRPSVPVARASKSAPPPSPPPRGLRPETPPELLKSSSAPQVSLISRALPLSRRRRR